MFLGSDEQFPSCECVDFKQHYLPCKHIFAIFKVIPGYSWNSLPACFTNSPLFSLDVSVYSEDEKQNLECNICVSPAHENDVVANDQMSDNEVPQLETTEDSTDPELPSSKAAHITLSPAVKVNSRPLIH